MKGKIINNQHNNCWFWSSVRIMNSYIQTNGIPKELSNEYIKKSIDGENIIIDKYNEETLKQADVDKALNGNAVEFLVVNGFYHDGYLTTNNLPPSNELYLKINGVAPFALLLQYPGHYSCVINENNKFIMYNAIADKECYTLLQYDDKNNILIIPRNSFHMNIYIYNVKH